MKLSVPFRMCALLALCFSAIFARADLRYEADFSPRTVTVNNTVTFTYKVDNISSPGGASGIQVIANYPTSAAFVSATNDLANSSATVNRITTVAGRTTFNVDSLAFGADAVLTLRLTPTVVGDLISTVTFQAAQHSSTNFTLEVEVVPGPVDISLRATNLPPSLLVGDRFNYDLIVNNAGTNTITGVSITNGLPTGARLLSIQPDVSETFSSGRLTIPVGTLTNRVTKTFRISAMVTNAGTSTLTAGLVVPAGQNTDTNLANNVATSELRFFALQTNSLVVENFSEQRFNPQAAVFEQSVQIKNVGLTNIPSFRLFVTNLAGNDRLYNATGTNAIGPFIALNQTLAPGQSNIMALRYFFPTRETFDAGFLAAEDPSAPVVTGPRMTLSTNDSFTFISFTTTPGKLYTLQRASSLAFTNAFEQSSILARSTSMTLRGLSATNAQAVFYRVIENQ